MRVLLVALLAFLGGIAACSAGAEERHPVRLALLVVGDASDPVEGDRLLLERLRSVHHLEVRVVAASGSATEVEGDLVVISESVESERVGPAFRDASVPVLVLENALYDDMMLGSGDGTATGRSELLIHEALAHGGPDAGVHEALSEPGDMKYVVGLAPGGEPLAGLPDRPERTVWFRFESGAPLVQDVAPARRVGLGFKAESYGRFLPPAWGVFDASVAWLLDAPRPDPTTPEPTPPATRTAMLLVGSTEEEAPPAEARVLAHLQDRGFDVTLVADEDLAGADAYDLVVMSKTVDSTVVGDGLKGTGAPVLFWEDNQQRLSMMATIDDDGESGTAWHGTESSVRLDEDAPEAFGAGLSGSVELYEEEDEITYAPYDTLGDAAIEIATFGGDGSDGRWAIYAYERGAPLADGTPAAGRRGYFGLYDHTFPLLTAEGLALFDAMVDWLVEPPTGDPEAGR